MTEQPVEVRPLTADRWDDLVRLLSPSGGYANCWCTWWRQKGSQFGKGCERGGAGNRALLRRLVDAGAEPGLLAYRGGDPIGWVSIAARPEFGRALRSPTLRPAPDEEADDPLTWSIVCFWMPRSERGHNVGTALLAAAVEHARQRGARVVEGYPIDTGGQKRSAAGIFTGTLAMFRRLGFKEVAQRRGEQPIVRISL